MIVDTILNIVYYFVYGLFTIVGSITGLLTWRIPTNWTDQVGTVLGTMSGLNQVFPLPSFVDVVGAMIIFETFLFFYHLLKWSWKKIPGLG